MNNAGLRILIVEDEPRWQKALMRCELLSRMKRQDPEAIVIVAGYEAARSQLVSDQFALAITDVVLESILESSTRSAWRELACLLQQRQVPIVVVSAYLNLDLVIEMINAYGVVGVFDKVNLDLRKFEARLVSILQR